MSYLDRNLITSTQDALDFVENILQSSTEYSIIGKDLHGTIVLWNEGARRIYGYEASEIVGCANASILHPDEERAAGKLQQIMSEALRAGKWEGTIKRIRKNGEQFMA